MSAATLTAPPADSVVVVRLARGANGRLRAKIGGASSDSLSRPSPARLVRRLLIALITLSSIALAEGVFICWLLARIAEGTIR